MKPYINKNIMKYEIENKNHKVDNTFVDTHHVLTDRHRHVSKTISKIPIWTIAEMKVVSRITKLRMY